MQNTCIDIGVKRVGDALSFGLDRLGEDFGFAVERKDDVFAFNAVRDGEMLAFSMKRKGKPVEFRCGLVCSVNTAAYLKVEPETIWLMPSNDFSQDVVVYANVTWRIE